ncbi:hypothetical protein chiPu_0018434 [Chiloscyllium punctatum]|uniref:Uncharacterized protein n=1 Tax=Chiloscyllium punctatum TaxID=137246 RepID=A0A401RNG0_CHIPU|nr:hypothetical protein [Chiloscyllium punctatum]
MPRKSTGEGGYDSGLFFQLSAPFLKAMDRKMGECELANLRKYKSSPTRPRSALPQTATHPANPNQPSSSSNLGTKHMMEQTEVFLRVLGGFRAWFAVAVEMVGLGEGWNGECKCLSWEVIEGDNRKLCPSRLMYLNKGSSGVACLFIVEF